LTPIHSTIFNSGYLILFLAIDFNRRGRGYYLPF
jgi:hypothetical protein